LSTPVSWVWPSVCSRPGRPNRSRSPDKPAGGSAGLPAAFSVARALVASSAIRWPGCLSAISCIAAATSGRGVPDNAWIRHAIRSSFFLTVKPSTVRGSSALRAASRRSTMSLLPERSWRPASASRDIVLPRRSSVLGPWDHTQEVDEVHLEVGIGVRPLLDRGSQQLQRLGPRRRAVDLEQPQQLMAPVAVGLAIEVPQQAVGLQREEEIEDGAQGGPGVRP